MSAPARIVRVTGFNDDLYVLDESGALWSFERRQYRMMWIALPRLPDVVVDLYVHAVESEDGSIRRANLRALNRMGRLFELRWVGSEYVWGEISLEAR